MLSGNNGVLQRATDAKTRSDKAQIKERIQLAYHSALTKDITGENGELTMETLQGELNNEFVGKTVTITPSADNKKWTIKVDDVEETVPAGKMAVASNLTDGEKTALQTNGIAEITGDDISNENLKNNNRIKAVLTGDVPLTTEMTYVTGTKDTGVVVSIDGNEFVWVPVNQINNMIMCKSHSGTSDCDIVLNDEKTGLYCKNHSNSTKLCGKLYALSTLDGFNANLSNQTFTFNNAQSNAQSSDYLREPDIITEYDNNSTYNNGLFSLESLNSEFKEMALSVAKFKGFYVARYELGIENGTPVSKDANSNSNVITSDANQDATKMWYGLYQKEKEMYNDNSKNVQSTMIWGCQYDAMIIWMGDSALSANKTNKNSETITGKKVEDKIKNVYDLYGCHYEWTLEANDKYNKNDRKYTYARIARGGCSTKNYAPSIRGSLAPTDTTSSSSYSSRPTIYIK